MKKNVLIVIILCAIIFGVLAFCAFRSIDHNSIQKIDPDQVEKITIQVYSSSQEQELSASDADAFIQFYNESKFGGKATGEGGTPEFGAVVRFVDGTYLRINDFGVMGHDFEVTLYDANGNQKKWYYIDSPEFYEFVSEMVNNATKR